ncbi:hypothetical protein ACQPTN_33500 [Bradyrhizobium sp. 13971]
MLVIMGLRRADRRLRQQGCDCNERRMPKPFVHLILKSGKPMTAGPEMVIEIRTSIR